MRVWVVAVGQRQPDWADEAWDDFAKRFPPEMRLELKALKAEPRTSGKTPVQCMAAEAQRIEAAIPKSAFRVVLDERGHRLNTVQMADRVSGWRELGRDVAIVIGGPDGLDPSIKATADDTWRLSDLTLPHAFVRVLLAEALYRAWSVSVGHPYHRE